MKNLAKATHAVTEQNQKALQNFAEAARKMTEPAAEARKAFRTLESIDLSIDLPENYAAPLAKAAAAMDFEGIHAPLRELQKTLQRIQSSQVTISIEGITAFQKETQLVSESVAKLVRDINPDGIAHETLQTFLQEGLESATTHSPRTRNTEVAATPDTAQLQVSGELRVDIVEWLENTLEHIKQAPLSAVGTAYAAKETSDALFAAFTVILLIASGASGHEMRPATQPITVKPDKTTYALRMCPI